MGFSKSNIDQGLEAAEKFIDEKRFSDAQRELSRLRDRTRHENWSVRDLSLLSYFQARVFYNLGRFHDALLKSKTSTRLAIRGGDDELYASEKLLFGLICASLGRFADAQEAFLESYAFRLRSGKRSGLWGPILNLALSQLHSGSVLRSIEWFRQAIDLSKRYNTEREIQICRHGFCIALWLSGSFNELSPQISDTRESSRKDVMEFRFKEVRGRLHAAKLDYQSAKLLLENAYSFFRSGGLERDQSICLEFLGLNEYFAGNYEKAREYYDQVLAMPEPTASAVAQTLRMLTDVEIAEGNWTQAKETAAKAEAAVTKINEKIELGALWRAYGHIKAHEGRAEEAKVQFRKSIDLLAQLGARYELALSYFDAGRCEVFTHSERVEQLRAARNLFNEMEVPKRVAQVDEAIKLLDGFKREESRKRTHESDSDCDESSATTGRSRVDWNSNGASTPTIVVASDAMKKVIALADRIKDDSSTVLITGETGTGKDLLAEHMHYTSRRADQPFKAVNCAAIPEALLESELFGFRKGTYTGANRDKKGLIEACEGGTFYFDEIGETASAIQAKLLRVIETKKVRRLGDNRDISVDVKFICATNRDLRKLVADGRFRSDLYYRISELPIELPALRERPGDPGALVEFFLQLEGITVDDGRLKRLTTLVDRYDWPGNIRQLRTTVRKAVAIGGDDFLSSLASLIDGLRRRDFDPTSTEDLRRLLEDHNGNLSGAAREIGIPESTYRYRLRNDN